MTIKTVETCKDNRTCHLNMYVKRIKRHLSDSTVICEDLSKLDESNDHLPYHVLRKIKR